MDELLVPSPTGAGKVKEGFERLFNLACERLTPDHATKVLAGMVRTLRSEINSAKYLEELKKPVSHPDISCDQMLLYFENEYPKLFGKFRNEPYLPKIIQKVAAILTKDIEACRELGVDPGKSVLLYGGVGVGKSSIMKTFQHILSTLQNPKYPTYRIKHAKEVALDFQEKGAVCMNRYTSLAKIGNIEGIGWLFEDMGTEAVAANYSNKDNVFETIIQLIDPKLEMRGKVHFTMNLKAQDVVKYYGERVESRLKAMCNPINFPPEAVNMRKI